MFFLKKVLFLCFILSPCLVTAQSNAVLDEIIAAPNISFANAAYLVLSAGEMLPADATPEQAVEKLVSLKWNLDPEENTDITLGEYCYLLLQTFRIQGGLMYTMFPSPRYAYKECFYLGFIKQTRPKPNKPLSGETAITILSRVLEWKGDDS